MLHLRPSVCWHPVNLLKVPVSSSPSCPQVSDKGGGVPFRRIENLFSYMYSTAPAPQIGEHSRTPLVSKAARIRIFYSHIPNRREWRRKEPDSGTICHLVAFLGCPLPSLCSVTVFILSPWSFFVFLLRLDLATACQYLGFTPSTSRETCSSTPWRATAQTPSSTWRWASNIQQRRTAKTELLIAHIYNGVFYDFQLNTALNFLH